MKKYSIVLTSIIAMVFGLSLALIPPKIIAKAESKTIVLDIGHGGIDNGAIGTTTGVKEAELNLQIGKKTRDRLVQLGYNVTLTREDDNALVDYSGSGFKRADMEMRRKLIEKVNPDIVVSIHQNKFNGAKYRRGAQVFTANTDESVLLGKTLQDNLNSNINMIYNGREYDSLCGNYYIIKCTKCPTVIVECSFLSNAEDERLIITENYQQELADSIALGITNYFYGQY